MAQQQLAREEKSLGDLFADLAAKTGTLVRQEVALAQAEVTHKATKAGKDIGYLVVGGTVAYVGVLAIVAAVIMIIGLFIPVWLSALIVGVVIGAIGFFMISSGLTNLKKIDPMPRNTVATIKEDVQWLKKEVS